MDQIVKFQEFRDVAGPFNIYYLGSANPNEVILKTSASFDDLYYGYQFSYADSPIHIRVMSLDPYLTQSSAYYYYPTTTTTTTTSTTTTTTTAEPTTTTSTTTSTTTAEPTTSTTTSTTTAEPTTTTSTTTTTTTEEPTTTTTSTTTTTTTAEPTTTTTTTTSTTTTTTTALTFYDHRRSNTGNATECNVCPPSYGSGFFYTSPSDSTPTIGMTVYSDSSLTTPFNGGNLWWGIEWDGPSSSTIDGILIGTDGVVDDTHICSVDCPTTTTTTTSTTTTPPVTTYQVLGGADQTEACNSSTLLTVTSTSPSGIVLTAAIYYYPSGDPFDQNYLAYAGQVWGMAGATIDSGPENCSGYTTTSTTTTTTTSAVTTTSTTTTTTTPAGLYVTLDTTVASGFCTSTSGCDVVTSPVTGSAVNGTAPYTYLWEMQTDDSPTNISVDTFNDRQTTFSYSGIPCAVGGTTYTGTYKLKVTDSASPTPNVAYSDTVTVTLTNNQNGGCN